MFNINMKNNFRTVLFKDIKQGDLFFILDHNMRIPYLKLRVDTNAVVNAVALDSAMLGKFSDSCEVHPMSATLVEEGLVELEKFIPHGQHD